MIRPIDLQNTILQSMQNAPAAQRAEDGSRLAAQAVQAQFAAEMEQRQESVVATSEASGNQIGEKPEGERGSARKRKRKPNSPFGEVVEDAAGSADEPHLIDFTA